MANENSAEPQVIESGSESRFVLEQHGFEAELVYQLADGRLTLLHTGVPEELGGQGIGGRLVQAAADKALREGLTLVPWCPFARRWLRDHAEAIGAVAIDWHSSPPA